MQLKKDTDYSLRLLVTLEKVTGGSEREISSYRLGQEAGVPPVIASRLCSRLSDNHLIHQVSCTNGEKKYYWNEKTSDKSLYDIVEVVEGKIKLYAAFDRNSFLFRQCGRFMDMTEKEVESCLKSFTLGDLISEKSLDQVKNVGSSFV